MARARPDGLGFLDRLVILIAWLASCGVVFVIGYYVGKDAVPPSAAIAPGAIQVPVAGVPVAADEGGAGGTFYESLGRQAGGPPPTKPTARATTTVPVRAASVESRTTTTAAPPRSTTTRPALVASTTTIPGPTSTTIRPPAAPTQVPGGRQWAVYVGPTRDRFEAERQRSELRDAGYDASVVRMQRDGDVWYRVRAGRFDSEASAERARRSLRERGVGRAFVQSE